MNKPKNRNINIPNALSLVRLVVIVPMVLYVLHGKMEMVTVMLAISGVSDFLDGYIARHYNQVTELGKMLDPVADKATQGALAICIAIRFPVLFGILVIFVVKEATMLVGACILFKKKKMPGGSKWYGKVATVLFYVTTGTIVFLQTVLKEPNGPAFYGIAIFLLTITAIASLYALYRYTLVAVSKLHSNAPEDQFDIKKIMNNTQDDAEVQSEQA